MLARLVTTMGGTSAPNPASGPVVFLLGVTQKSAGACTFRDPWLLESAVLTVAWTYDKVPTNPTAYNVKVYRDGVLVATRGLVSDSVNQSWDNELTGWVDGGDVSVWNHTYQYRVDIVRKSDGVVVSTKSYGIATSYGHCH